MRIEQASFFCRVCERVAQRDSFVWIMEIFINITIYISSPICILQIILKIATHEISYFYLFYKPLIKKRTWQRCFSTLYSEMLHSRRLSETFSITNDKNACSFCPENIENNLYKWILFMLYFFTNIKNVLVFICNYFNNYYVMSILSVNWTDENKPAFDILKLNVRTFILK